MSLHETITTARRWLTGQHTPAESQKQTRPPHGGTNGLSWNGVYTSLGYRAVASYRDSGGVIATTANSDYHARYDRVPLIRMSAQFHRDNCIYRGMIERALDNIVGEGFVLQARTKDEKLNKDLEALWNSNEWQNNPEIRGLLSWPDLERATMRELLLSGDLLAIFTESGLLQMIPSELIGGIYGSSMIGTAKAPNRVEQGIELTPAGTVVAYHVADYQPMGYVDSGLRRIPARDAIYLAEIETFSQVRGVPAAESAFSMLHRMNATCDAEAAARQILSRLAFAIIKKGASQSNYADSTDRSNGATEYEITRDRLMTFDEATIASLEPGEDIKPIDHSTPGPDFDGTVRTFLRLAGTALGMPLELILLDFSQTNYSSARGALLQAYRAFRCKQARLARGFHSPVYRWKVNQWLNEGQLGSQTGAASRLLEQSAFGHTWQYPTFDWIDPLKEALSWQHKLEAGLTTQRCALAAEGHDFDEYLVDRAGEIQAAITVADGLNAKNPNANVQWQHLIGMGESAPETPVAQDETGTSGTQRGEPARDENKGVGQ